MAKYKTPKWIKPYLRKLRRSAKILGMDKAELASHVSIRVATQKISHEEALEQYTDEKLRELRAQVVNAPERDLKTRTRPKGLREWLRRRRIVRSLKRAMEGLTLNSLGPIYGVQRISGETNRQYKRRILRAAHVIDTVQLRWPVRPVEPKEQGHE